ncbi:2-C-methyl-D-erythritol 4-phosphate cytidylyltransferase [bacterium]|nr:2-C-methyl-D-erythritol 4-phosphate cytidylyltransferase [bacterium]
MISVIITAGGTSSRFGKENKLLYRIKGKTVLEMTVEKFLDLTFVDKIIISANEAIIPDIPLKIKENAKIEIIEGGETRQQSVFNALKICNNCKTVIIHDGARPFISPHIIEKCFLKAQETKAAIVAVKTTDTIKIVNKEGIITSTPNRETLWNAQTPQIFDYNLIFNLHKKHEGQNYTDDALLCEKENIPVYIVEGEYSNIKITTFDDVKNMCSL